MNTRDLRDAAEAPEPAERRTQRRERLQRGPPRRGRRLVLRGDVVAQEPRMQQLPSTIGTWPAT